MENEINFTCYVTKKTETKQNGKKSITFNKFDTPT